MRMKSVFALTALSAATFLASVAYAADARPAKQTNATKATAIKVQDQATEVAATPASADETAAAPQAKKTGHKKHAHHKKHNKHKRHHHHRGHHHANDKHHHDHFHDHYHVGDVYQEIPSWNFLVGGSLGYAIQQEKFTTRYTGISPIITAAPGNYRDHGERITEQGVMFSVLGGWQWRCNRFLLGAEANVDFNSYEKDRQFAFLDVYTFNQGIVGTVLYDRGDIFSVTGRAGYFVTPFFMPYIRLGAQMSRDEVSYQALVNVPGAPGVAAPDFSSRKKDVYGLIGGIGAEFPTYIGSSTIRFEYNYTKTESVIIEDNAFPIIGNHKFKYPETHIGKIAWIWNFM